MAVIRIRSFRPVVALAFVVVTSCEGDIVGVRVPPGVETAVVLNSVDISLTVFPVDSPENRRTLGLAQDGTPVSLAARGNLVAVPLGLFPALALVNLGTGQVRTIPLLANSGATGAAFANDSLVYVANPNRNSVSVVNILRGTLGPEITVGVFPQAIVAAGNRVFVLNSELDSLFQPARAGRISVIDPGSSTVTNTIELSGFNPGDATVGPDGLLYVVNSGSFGAGNGSLSVVNRSILREAAHHPGFGDFPGRIAFDPLARAYISSFSFGIAIWDPATGAFIRPPSNPLVVPGFPASSSGVAFDSRGRLYSLVPECAAPGAVLRLNADLSFDRKIDVGTCPFGILFTEVVD